MAKPPHKVIEGECLSSIAKRYGFSNWRTIYNYDKNREFREKRPDPNLIYPGDEIFIPEKEPKHESRGHDARHKFKRKTQPTFLRLVLLDEKRRPLSGVAYKLVVDMGEPIEKSTGKDGLVEHEIAADAEEAVLTVWPDPDAPEDAYTFTLKLGHLDPAGEPTGLQARLNNLGFYCGSEYGEIGPKTRSAMQAFQEAYGLPSACALGDILAKLKSVYGC